MPSRKVNGVTGSSPHTRGAHLVLAFRAGDYGIIPAYAGSTKFRSPYYNAAQDHPRIRGEHAFARLREAVADGSSPHTRGAPAGVDQHPLGERIIPAYAGSTGGQWTQDKVRVGSSPHTRGAQECRSISWR